MQLIVAIIIAILIYTLQQRIYRKQWNKRLTVRISFDSSYVEPGGQACITEVINNEKRLPLPVLHVKFATDRSFTFSDYENASVTDSYYRNDVFSVMGNRKITRRLTFRAERRGFYRIDAIDVISRDFFMTRSYAESFGNQAELYVFPKKLRGSGIHALCNAFTGETEVRRHMQEDPYTFRGIRDYDSRDGMRRINWKATARTGSLMVNLYSNTTEQRIMLLLNLEPNAMLRADYLQEVSISLTSSVAEYFLQTHMQVGLASNGTDMLTGELGSVEAGASDGHMVSLDKCLARISGNAGIEAFLDIVDGELANVRTNVSYIIISPYYKEELLLKLDYMVHLGISVNMLVPHYDILPLDAERSYIHGWEVKLNET